MHFSEENRDIIRNQIRLAKIEEYLKSWFEKKIDLQIFLAALGEITVGTKVICEKNHISQLDFLWDVISGKVTDYVLWANRAGSKTYFAGFITWLKSCHFKRHETTLLGASGEQSAKAYKAMDDFWRMSNMLENMLSGEPLMKKSQWKNGSVVSILTASQTSVRGPHPNALLLDEVDEMDEDIYEAALSQPISKYGILSSTGIYSTHHNIDGTMEKALRNVESGGFKLFKYCVWECIESCEEYRCSMCKLSSICPGKQVKDADGYYKIEDLIKKLNQLSWDTIQREWLCEKVGRGDLVYQEEWDEDLHVVDVSFSPNMEVYLSVDWGGVHPFAVGVWQDFPELGWVRVDEVYMGNTTNKRLLSACKKKTWWNNIDSGVADPSRADLISEWEDEGIILQPANNAVDEGIEGVKGALKPVLGNPKFYINRTCVDCRREFKSYRIKNGKIVKENDHIPDETRYFTMWKIKEKEATEHATYETTVSRETLLDYDR